VALKFCEGSERKLLRWLALSSRIGRGRVRLSVKTSNANKVYEHFVLIDKTDKIDKFSRKKQREIYVLSNGKSKCWSGLSLQSFALEYSMV
jgi:hypothetical protein